MRVNILEDDLTWCLSPILVSLKVRSGCIFVIKNEKKLNDQSKVNVTVDT